MGSSTRRRSIELADGVTIDGVDYMGVEAKLDREQGSNAWLTLGLREGKNREIKKILEHLGLAVNRLIRVSFGPFELGDLPEGEVVEVRTRVLRDQLGVKLAKEANVDFDAPQIIAIESPPEGRPGERPRTRSGAPRGESSGPSGRCPADLIVERAGARNASKGMPRHAASHRNRRRLSAAANMSRCCARKSPQTQRPRASGSSAARPRTARGGPSRSSACRGLSKRRPRPPRPKRRNTGERGGRSFRSSRPCRSERVFRAQARARRRRTRAAAAFGAYGEWGSARGSSAGRTEGGPRERRFDRPPARSDGDRRDGPPRARSAGDPPRERKFDRPQGRSRSPSQRRPASAIGRHGPRRAPRLQVRTTACRGARRRPAAEPRSGHGRRCGPPRERKFERHPGRTRPPAGEGRPPRSDDTGRGARPDFKSRPPRAGARDGDRPQSRVRDTGGDGGPPRERRFDRPEAKRDGDRRERPPSTRGAGDPARERKFDRPQGRTRPGVGDGRPPRSDDKSRGPRSDFKSRPPRAGARDGDRPQSRGAAAKADRRAVAPRRSGARHRGKDRRKAPAVHAGRRESRDRCELSAAASRAACC